MKKIYYILLFFVVISCELAVGQTDIVKIEYFLDVDPGYNNAIPVSFPSSPDVQNANIPIDPDTISDGVHRLNVRAMNSKGKWSMLNSIFFYKPFSISNPPPTPAGSNVTRMEYFLDTDPGYNNATPIAFNPSEDVQNAIIAIDPNSLTDGVHRMNVRALNSEGKWSMINSVFFYKPFSLSNPPPVPVVTTTTRIEYFIDADPGYNNATPVSFSPSEDLQNTIISIDPSALTDGVHRMNVRALNSEGKWSMINSVFFYKPFSLSNPPPVPVGSPITRIEYFIDTDPGYNNATPVSFTSTDDVQNAIITITPSILTEGVHRLNVRAQNSEGKWSMINSVFFYKPFNLSNPPPIPANTIITRIEYFIDVDPGFNNATSIAFNSSEDVQGAIISIDPSTLTDGVHRLNVRAMNSSGNWSMINSVFIYKPFSLDNPPPLPSLSDIVRLEYYIDSDPGYGYGTALNITPTTDLQNAIIAIDPANLTDGVHHLYVRALNSNGNWSMMNALEFHKTTILEITSQPDSINSICINSDVILTSTAIGVQPVTVQWQKFVNGAWTDISGATFNNFTISNAQLSDSGSYRAVFYDVDGSLASNISKINVYEYSLGGNLTGNDLVCPGNNNGLIEVENYRGNVIRWEYSTNGINWNSISNLLSELNYSNLTSSTYYRSVIQNGACPEEHSDIITIDVINISDNDPCTDDFCDPSMINVTHVLNQPSVTASSNSPLCSGATLQLNSTSAQEYNWTGPNGFISSIQNPIIIDVNTIAQGLYTVTITNIAGCTATSSVNVQINSNQLPVLDFSGNNFYSNHVVNPLNGTPTDIYRFEINYLDQDGDLPAQTYPRVNLDFEGNGSLLDFNDKILVMQPLDVLDSNTTDGKIYFASLHFMQESENWKTSFTVTEQGGCSADLGPFDEPNSMRLPDVSIFANDISFSNPFPSVNSFITVSAQIHNNSSKSISNIVAHLVNYFDSSIVYPDIVIPYIPPSGVYTASWTIQTPPVPAYCPVRVYADYTNVISEPNELDNNAIRPFINGNYIIQGNINVNASLSSDTLCPGAFLSVSGNAYYSGLSVPLQNASCAGASVKITVIESGQIYNTSTSSSGNFNLSFNIPVSGGNYNLLIEATDYSLSSVDSFSFFVLPECPVDDDTCIVLCYDLCPSITLLHGTNSVGQSTVLQGETIDLDAYVHNGTDDIYSGDLHIHSSDYNFSPSVYPLPQLFPGENTLINFPSFSFSNPGNSYVYVWTSTCFDVINFNVLPVLPDLYPSSINIDGSCTSTGVNVKIKNLGGVPSGNFQVRLIVNKDGNTDTTMLQTVNNINPLEEEFINFSFDPLQEGGYTFNAEVDYPDDVNEYIESNNSISGYKQINNCKPDLIIGSCGFLNAIPEDAVLNDNVTLSLVVFNYGLAATNSPFKVKVNTGQSIYTHLITNTIQPSSFETVNIIAQLTGNVNQEIEISVDSDNEIEESDENNTIRDNPIYDFSLSRLTNTPSNSEMFWDHTQLTLRPLYFSVGLANTGLLDASHVKVKFEVNGPGLNGWVSLGESSVYSQNLRIINGQVLCQSNMIRVQSPTLYAFQQSGAFQVRMTVDHGDEYPERNETNNVLIVDVEVSDFSDYRILSQYINPSSINPDVNEDVSFNVTYENIGNNDADSMEIAILGDNILFDSMKVRGLPGFDYSTISFANTWSSSLPGVHVIRTNIDNDNSINETNEQNNEATRAIVVGPTPNLRFQTFSISNPSPNLGNLVYIHAVIENTGKQKCSANYDLHYRNNFNQEVLIQQQTFFIDSNSTILITIPWFVADKHTILTGNIFNSNPPEFDLSDNTASIEIGNIQLFKTGSYASCATNNQGVSRVIINGGQPPYFIQWSNGRITDTIVDVPGIYSVIVTDIEGSSATMIDTIITDPFTFESCGNNTDDNCNGLIDENCSATLNLKVFIQGFYLGSGSMIATIDPVNLPLLCDTILVELHNNVYPYYSLSSYKGVIDINGNGIFQFPDNVEDKSFYIVVYHRNSIVTWSKYPVLFDDKNIEFDFTDY